MLTIAKKMEDLDFPALMDVYIEGNREKAEEYGDGGLLWAEQGFYEYLNDDFFRHTGAFYALWNVNGKAVSALRMEHYSDGLLLEALETMPEYRRMGYAKSLITAVLEYLPDVPVYSHVSKRNEASLRSHYACGFENFLDHAVYIDGSVTHRAYTLCWPAVKK